VVGWLNILGMIILSISAFVIQILLGQVAGVSSTEFGLSNMIWSAVALARVSDSMRPSELNVLNYAPQPGYEITSGKVVGLFAALLVIHGILVCPTFDASLLISPRALQNSLATRYLAWMTKGFVFINLGATFCVSTYLHIFRYFHSRVPPLPDSDHHRSPGVYTPV